MSYIYKVTNRINGKMYIGQHRYDGAGLDKSYKGSGILLWKAYDKYGIENFDMELVEECPEEDLNPLEQLYIEHYNTLKPNGYNLTEGGGGCSGFKKSEETLEKISIRIAQYSTTGKFIRTFRSSKEAGRQLNISPSLINECCNGKHKSAGGFIWRFYENDDDITDLSQYKPNTRLNDIERSKPINQYDDNGDLVKTYPSIAEVTRQLNCSWNDINRAVKNHNAKAYGFRFRYANEYGDKIEPYIKPRHNREIKVNQYDKNGVLINSFNSATEAAKYIGASTCSLITSCCKGKYKTAYGYIWEYAETKKAA